MDIDRNHQIETQQREVGQIVLRQTFASQMYLNATQATKTIDCDADALEIRKLNAAIVANHHIFHPAGAVY